MQRPVLFVYPSLDMFPDITYKPVIDFVWVKTCGWDKVNWRTGLFWLDSVYYLAERIVSLNFYSFLFSSILLLYIINYCVLPCPVQPREPKLPGVLWPAAPGRALAPVAQAKPRGRVSRSWAPPGKYQSDEESGDCKQQDLQSYRLSHKRRHIAK